MQLILHSLAYPVTALGPGRRVALWVAGCPMRCPGCITPELLDAGAGRAIAVDHLAARLLRLEEEFDGVTLSGGEPFAQAGALAALLDRVLPARPRWSVIAFSGFRLQRLQRMGAEVDRLLGHVDVLVDGPYVRTIPSVHPLAGSGNQEVHYLTTRGRALRPAIEALPDERANLALGPGGGSMLVGIFGPERRRAYHRALGLEGGRGTPKGTTLRSSESRQQRTNLRRGRSGSGAEWRNAGPPRRHE